MKELYVKTKRGKLDVNLPTDWKLLTFAEFSDHPERSDISDAVTDVLKNPTGSAALSDLVSPEEKVAIIVEDLTRVSPKKSVLKTLLKLLETLSIPDQNIAIVMALGTHRALDNTELSKAFGADLVNRYIFLNHDCLADDLVTIDQLKSGTPVKINAEVYKADFRIGIGSIFPHPLNGFGGGSKILFPGVADYDSILEHHLAYAFRNGSDLGITDENPFHEEIKRLGVAGKLDFIINSVLDHNDKLYDIVAGEPNEAQKAGIKKCREAISKRFERKSDCTIISAFPYSEGNQIMKPLAPATLITKKGGCVILVADCTAPLAEAYLAGCEKFRAENEGNLRKRIFELFGGNQRILADSPPEFNMSMAQALLGQEDFHVILVTEDIEPDQIKRIGFLPAENLERAVELAQTFTAAPMTHVVPSGGVILPVIQETM